MHMLICALIVTNHRRQVFSVAVQFYHERLENKMRNLIIVKYDNSELYFAQSLQSICSVYVDIPRVILLVTVFLLYNLRYTTVNMVIIDLYKPRATHMKYTEGK